MNRLTKFLSSFLLLGALALSGAANAKVTTSTTDLGTISGNATIGLDNAFGLKTDKFVDYFTFDLTSAASFASVTNSFSLGNLYGIDHLTVRLFAGDGPFGKSDNALSTAWTTVFNGPLGFESWTGMILPLMLSASNYTLQISGNVTGMFGGSYEGAMLVSAVPEPATYAMMLLGLGLLGFAARRKSQK